MHAHGAVFQGAVHRELSHAFFDAAFCHLTRPCQVPHLQKMSPDATQILNSFSAYSMSRCVASMCFVTPKKDVQCEQGHSVLCGRTWIILSSSTSNSTLSAPSGGSGSRAGEPSDRALLVGQLMKALSPFASEQMPSSKPTGTCRSTDFVADVLKDLAMQVMPAFAPHLICTGHPQSLPEPTTAPAPCGTSLEVAQH